MNRDAVIIALDYIEDQTQSAQITYIGKGEYTIDFQNRIHAEVCQSELKDAGFYNTRTLLTGHHMRVE